MLGSNQKILNSSNKKWIETFLFVCFVCLLHPRYQFVRWDRTEDPLVMPICPSTRTHTLVYYPMVAFCFPFSALAPTLRVFLDNMILPHMHAR
jgi:hypothetical protein